ncbi:helix-turn-helix domain-containing protein [Nocardiopsis ganjiahuensis]|uniref:helix-turn-helix domain-containing protein n=1 Tax=Nocardiopsis ganjiahuensis TaxID=239984 RepID=UPI000349F809|nr:helix-turn-helix domain-containing protein [Nocardiopsis ganjiahuensis]
MHPPDGWSRLVDLVERVVSEDDLLSSVVAGARAAVDEVAVLPPADMTGHTRALMAAAIRAVTARRGPTEAELSFVEELAVVRAGQGVPVEAVLAAIHVSERAIWSRVRAAAAAEGVGAEPLLDARELYGDWADAVRSRLITAHRTTRADLVRTADHTSVLVRRLLEGGSAAALAATEARLPAEGLWVTVRREPLPHPSRARSRRVEGAGAAPLSAVIDGLEVWIGGREPRARSRWPVGAAGPAGPGDLATLRDQAVAALTAAEATGRSGLVHIADVAALAAVVERPDLAAALLEHHRTAWDSLGPGAEPVALAVRAWFEEDRDAARAANRLFVHPNTVRNRIQRFTEATGIDPATPLGAVNAWWLARSWLERP